MLKLSKSWGIPIMMYGILLVVVSIPGFIITVISLFTSGDNGSNPSTWETLRRMAVALSWPGIGVWMIVYGSKIKSRKSDTDGPAGRYSKGSAYRSRVNFYLALALSLPPFFLLHWNWLLDFSYHWYLVRIGGVREFQPQLIAALASTVLIYGVVILMYELGLRKKKHTRPAIPDGKHIATPG